ncbi:helix-turn-helix domain-containing protein [Pectinatus sottacetonis]|uniref:helix-turn-helix domain-containing protein n=1 Tax=Pectinatus sottacetonis TaxID=1002795 RepID=UPI0018C826B5|nr:helix-turn-helix transcriptional regulator [Pectinatus sottacetonis]
MNSVKDELAKNLAYYRKRLKLTQRDLAVKLGVKHNTISSWENGTNSIDLDILLRICKILNITLLDIYGKYAEKYNPFTPSEREHIEKYRALDQRGKNTIDFLLQYECTIKDTHSGIK